MLHIKKIMIIVILVTLFLFSQVTAEVKQTIKELKPVYTAIEPKMDGKLDDKAWSQGPIVDDVFITYNPIYGDLLPQKTKVYLAYDHDNLYFAFYCYDTEPDKIKTSITKHDGLFNDDWVGFAIDTIGSNQFAYEFFMNPNGMQADLFNSSSTGEDSAPDYVWFSGGQVVKDGYIVECKIPLKNFRYKDGKDIEMKVIFWRRISRLGLSGSWPEIKTNASILSSTTKVTYGQLDKQLVLEFLPSLTYSNIKDRTSPDVWSDPDDTTDFGITGKYGITSSITGSFTYNPDFSQVETDSFQVLVNQRYPIFYSEKRPFFMELGNLFSIAGTGNGDYNMRKAVHTRRIVDPEWGLKLQGEEGKLAFALLAAADEYPGRAFDDEEINLLEGEKATYVVGRAKYSLGKNTYVGALYSGRDFGDGYNKVYAVDFKTRFSDFGFNGNYMYSETKDSETLQDTNGSAWFLEGYYSTKPFVTMAYWEHLDKGFNMDTAFYSRSAMDQVTLYIGPQLYPKDSWIKKFNPFFWGWYIHDLETGLDDYFYLLCLRFNFIKQGQLRIDYRQISENYMGNKLDVSYFYTQGQVQLTNWLNIYGWFRIGDDQYYDDENSYVGDAVSYRLSLTIQPDHKFNQYLSYQYEKFCSKEDGSEIYDISILRSRTTYQFNKKLFIRAVVQYDSYQEIVLADMLAAYKINPQTVLYLGYGSLYENLSWQNNQWEEPSINPEYYNTTQTIFFKASYLFQI